MFDLHCHILPGMDDGARNAAVSRALLERERADGVKGVVFTPHFYAERESAERFLRRREAAAQAAAPLCETVGMRWRVGAEVAYTPFLADMEPERFAFSGTPYLLLELPFLFEPPDVEGLIARLVSGGLTPILAHIERYSYIAEDPARLYRWVRSGALAQVNASWLLESRQSVRCVRQLDRWGLVHLAASDTHSEHRRPPELAAGLGCLPDALADRLRRNAAAVFAGEPLSLPEPTEPVQRFGRWK